MLSLPPWHENRASLCAHLSSLIVFINKHFSSLESISKKNPGTGPKRFTPTALLA